MKTKLTESVKQAIVNSGLRSGMTISFHHHLRNGDYVLNMVLEAIAELGIGDLTVNASSLFDAHRPLKEHIKNGVVTTLQTDYIIVAWVVFMIVKAFNKMKDGTAKLPFMKNAKGEEVIEHAPTCPFCLEEINVGATRCPHCTAELPAPAEVTIEVVKK